MVIMMETYFASPERKPLKEIRESSARVVNDQIADALLRGFGGFVLIINEQRQILAANTNLLDMLQLDSQDGILGLRPGEAIQCVHSDDCVNGCGTGEYCRYCGAVKCVLDVQETNMAAEGECLMNLGPEGSVSMEFSIRAFPIYICSERLVVVLLRDIREEKFNEALEQTFFHDILNTLNGVLGYSEMFDYSEISQFPELARKIKLLSERLSEEVKFQRTVRSAASDEYEIPLQEVRMAEIASKLDYSCNEYWKSKGRSLEVAPVSEKLFAWSDPILIYRILYNMVKNGMEEVDEGEKVRLSCKAVDGSIVWEVWNQGVIPKDVAPRIFQRFFSTKKAKGRGLGTYSMKLFGEHFLGGKVAFSTSEEGGTVFSFTLPPRTGDENFKEHLSGNITGTDIFSE